MMLTDEKQTLAIAGVKFFGEISASISHEFKNLLSIFNENAGLLQDLAKMAENGIPLTPERVVRMAEAFRRQVARGDDLAKTMNRFAHSVDHPHEQVDVGEFIGFILKLTFRLITMKGAVPQLSPPETPVSIVTHPFFLANLIWSGLVCAMGVGMRDTAVRISAEATPDGATVRFYGLDPAAMSGRSDFPTDSDQRVADALGARIVLDPQNGAIFLMLPSSITKQPHLS